MPTIVILMLVLQVASVLVTAFAIMFGRPRAGKARSDWKVLAISTITVGGVSTQIAERHAGERGAELLMLGAPLLVGIGLTIVFLLVRQRRGLDAAL